MRSFTAILAVLTSALLVSAQAVPQGQAAPKAQAAAQACWKCPPNQGLFKFQQQAGSDPLHCQFLKDGMTYYCDYKVADGTLIYNVNDAFCPASAVPSRMRFWSEVGYLGMVAGIGNFTFEFTKPVMSNPFHIITQNVWPVAVKLSGTKEYQEDFDSARDEWMKYAYLEFSETKDRRVSNILITWPKDDWQASSGIQFYKAFTMLMYPGREPDDMTIDEALKAAGIHFQADDTEEERKKGKIATDIKAYVEDGDYENARKNFIVVLQREQEAQKGHAASTQIKNLKKSDVETKGDFEDVFNLSTAVKEAVEWVANNQSDDNDNPEREEENDHYDLITTELD
ncbi:uncharacterized protein LACBIDRAFT_335888 [Laccaria bicolor S238N-H82]|uniref:Predicted protein n=1 Tax=Laccaria bicolor (strain S238N-H82 / ATCC MYA-4686) TaxID=486041 RepID=B0DZ08_LACBS|nr:uncharacterized protein LACBIDRAFT_295828 [Laccaria bicolor S238N-H82]XP_001890828.1 uncharacterized protein LACBIDRAFT_335888 [Laccaria bicolor S238N-H82]EDQ98523.1 predicted protein [Laccaria bicolor S238N-H82]EDR00111.1 predicted protein [Laccaria bicolor S238N-H82]|eukprot:XP_001889168.1 predicted protein [Laccaria bicolor S238N-H82]